MAVVEEEWGSYTYSFSGDPRATFAQFFGTSDPFSSFSTWADWVVRR